ncbi:MAG: hypothetical protein MRT15_04195 [archaeon YNP-LCB-003-016]|uniref:hypothetical protein n=1 Tax=Candidatus Culexarchaeum yellowstonense TaxID=2928963 RepID=UPI0026EEC2C3|nr:hypothetical protein [Candidatus Culexarchaeum yellowstonense]MCR6691569.1 hypothetical protein [Candidatus Culexarchaeum yellowstonense]
MKRIRNSSSGRLTEAIHVRLTNDELEFIRMISMKTGLSLSESVRLAINMFRIILGLEAVDVEKVGRALREASEKALKSMSKEELEELKSEMEWDEEWMKLKNSKQHLGKEG